jgi:hypothetical protein
MHLLEPINDEQRNAIEWLCVEKNYLNRASPEKTLDYHSAATKIEGRDLEKGVERVRSRGHCEFCGR